MPGGSACQIDPAVGRPAYRLPAAALGIWNPWLVGVTKWSVQVQEAFGTLASEWQNFVSDRKLADADA